MNPLFPDDAWYNEADHGYLMPKSKNHAASADPAIELIRRKITNLYANEPNARQEAALAEQMRSHRSKHQEYMYRLTTSGQPLAEIQTAWHNYYSRLADHEKHEVWQEFYAANARHRAATTPQPVPMPVNDADNHPRGPGTAHHLGQKFPALATERRTLKAIKKTVLKHVRSSGIDKINARQHLQSLAFGLGLGLLAVLFVLFGLFNQLIITPFIKPGSGLGDTPIILSAGTPAPSETTELIVPKINAQLPVIYGSQSLAESDIQRALEDGIFHYPTTTQPGQQGNAAYFGHSSNNIFNKGKYKFAFVLLKELEPGDIFYLTYDKTVYTYKVYDKKIVNPEDTWVLGPVEGKTATAALITCDPPGTSRHRLVVWGEQVSPDPNGNTAQAAPPPALETQGLPGNGPGPWTRFWRWLF